MNRWEQVKPWGLALGMIAVLGINGCRTNSHGDEAQVRLINAVAGSNGLAVSIDGQKTGKEALFGSSTGYQEIGTGQHRVRLGANSPERPTLTLEKGRRYTLVALDESGARMFWEEDAPGSLPLGKAQVRLVQAAPGAGTVDLVVNSIVGLKAVGYGRRSQPLNLDGGSYDFKLVTADTPDTLAGPIRLQLDPGHTYTLAAVGRAGEMSLEAYPDGL